ncbi:MAG: fumarylacetoacetate hydrolase family protein [Burkholderiales bacterium]|nr:fumarylacetoacetate hydrolase family protein [Burkholderiales bacterium]
MKGKTLQRASAKRPAARAGKASRAALVRALAERVDTAARNATGIAQLSAMHELSLAEAYAVQRASIARRIARGEKRIGMKMGFTSRAKMVQMGLSDLIWGRLTDAMIIEEGGSLSLKDYVHPRVEPEIAFLLKKPLAGRVTALEAQAAVEAIAVAMEVIDSRYENFKFSLADVVADNTSAAGVVIGPWHAPHVDYSNLGLVLSFDGAARQVGSTAGILGHPLRSLVAAARMAGEAGEVIQAGEIVMAGGITAAEALTPGSWVETEMQHLGRVGLRTLA